jgi:hypothetical protein
LKRTPCHRSPQKIEQNGPSFSDVELAFSMAEEEDMVIL